MPLVILSRRNINENALQLICSLKVSFKIKVAFTYSFLTVGISTCGNGHQGPLQCLQTNKENYDHSFTSSAAMQTCPAFLVLSHCVLLFTHCEAICCLRFILWKNEWPGVTTGQQLW